MNAAEKSAIVMLTLGDVLAAEVFKHLNAHEVKTISSSMVNMAGFTHDQMASVLRDFKNDSSEYAALSLNTNEYLRSVLVKAPARRVAGTDGGTQRPAPRSKS